MIEVVREVPLSVEQAWARMTDWPEHGKHAPMTTISITPTGFNARTALGPCGFDDPMDVVTWEPPHFCRIVKRGRLVKGWAEIRVEPLGENRSRVTWSEDIHVAGVPRFAKKLEARAGQALFSRVVTRLLA